MFKGKKVACENGKLWFGKLNLLLTVHTSAVFVLWFLSLVYNLWDYKLVFCVLTQYFILYD